MKLTDCKHPEDLDELDRETYVRLATTPATQLDLVRARLETRECLEAFSKNLETVLGS